MACVNSPSTPHYHWLQKHQRLQVQHGPIELVIQIDGDIRERAAAFKQAAAFFDTVLVSLVSELPLLRSPASSITDKTIEQATHSVVSLCMVEAVKPYSDTFVTPMAAVAGSVAQCVLFALCRQRNLSRASVNNGGDIAIYLNDNAQYAVGICSDLKSACQDASVIIGCDSTIRGIATSGWQGRSHSLGIADAVTVLSNSAATSDVAATLIANHINLPGSTKIHSVAANELLPDSDLGSRAVTVDVEPLLASERRQALLAGERYAQILCDRGLIDSAYLSLQGENSVVTHRRIKNNTRQMSHKVTHQFVKRATKQAEQQAFNQ